ncbi:MAG: hypothetical protein EOO29_50625 [Comamonadaceae bacterium]|nr:MAG: hypothetical protein EOO29_50625 [Comamonadaceae bacterium]
MGQPPHRAGPASRCSGALGRQLTGGPGGPGHIEPNLLALLRWLIAGLPFALPARAELWAHRVHLRPEAWRYRVLGTLGMWICGA